MDFCNVMDYRTIIEKERTGLPFEKIFRGRRPSDDLANFSEYRNSVMHNRTMTELEEKNGEAALLWLSGVLPDKDDVGEANGDEKDVTKPRTRTLETGHRQSHHRLSRRSFRVRQPAEESFLQQLGQKQGEEEWLAKTILVRLKSSFGSAEGHWSRNERARRHAQESARQAMADGNAGGWASLYPLRLDVEEAAV